jgi:membrane-bound lytic murein transglycosylase F
VMYPVLNGRVMQEELAKGRADIAAAQLTADAAWERVGDAANVYQRIPQLVVYKRGKTRPRSTLQIENARLSVRAGSPQQKLLERLKRTVAPNLEWIETAPRSADPLDDVKTGLADYAVIDAREYSFSRHLYPDILVAFTLPEERPVQWVVRRNATDLRKSVDAFFRATLESGDFQRLAQRESGFLRPFEYEDSRKFQQAINTRLARYRPLFEEASAQTGVDWRLLAAMGYQESKWNPVAESPNGAFGVMMLTASTAESLGVSDRADPRQNIFAGARYFVEVRKKIPARIQEPDRTWFAVASYNVGFGHLEDARIITQIHGKNPDSWKDVRDHLPLLAQEQWHSRVKRGYARGWEPVQFVSRVQRFLELLEWQSHALETLADQPTRVEISPEDEEPA